MSHDGAAHGIDRRTLAVLGIVATWCLAGCEQEARGPVPTVVVTTEMSIGWELLPHRISHLELTLDPVEETGGVVRAANDGGTFGLVDTPGVRYGVEVWRSRQLWSRAGSTTVEIPPGSEVDGEPFSARVTVTLPLDGDAPADALDADAMAVLIRGYAIDTDAYETPPPFETDPVLPYDPFDGFTTQGVGIRLGAPALQDGAITFPVTARNSLGLSDRGDMNAAIPQATTWVRVDYLVVAALDGGRAVRADVAYELSTAEYGRNTVHPHADDAAQELAFAGSPGVAVALFGISSFDLWANVDEHRDPECVVTQDATNALGEPISGPGRYLTSLEVRLWDTEYDATAGSGRGRLDLHISNTSVSLEVGNLCVGAHGEAVMLQVNDPDAARIAPEPAELTFEAGSVGTQEVVW